MTVFTKLTTENNNPRYWAVIPAAGSGRRMGSSTPKQYLELAGKTVIEHTLQSLESHPAIHGIVVAVSQGDPHWERIRNQVCQKLLLETNGGKERYNSVLNALERLASYADPNDWVLVHDAARPCLRHEDIDRLLDKLSSHPVGGLLGIPVADTVKRVDTDTNITETIDRSGLWRALTPQMFRLNDLIRALRLAISQNRPVTDEASAIEWLGLIPQLVEGHADNIKITHPQDLSLAELYLAEQGEI